MYDRKVDDKILDFEASGSLYHSALIFQDDQTESYWAMVQSEAIGGELQGKKLSELPISEKMTWSEWVAGHPNTEVLSVNGQTHVEASPYDNYFNSDKVFKPIVKPDERLKPKTSIFTFTLDDTPFAVPHATIFDGWQGKAGKKKIFVYRRESESFYRSTRAWLLSHNGKAVKLKQKGDGWTSPKYGRFNPDKGTFEKGGVTLQSLGGWDSFWYIWSQYNQGGNLLDK